MLLQSYLYYIVHKLCPLVYASFLNLDLRDDLIKPANKDHQLLQISCMDLLYQFH